MGHKGRLKTTPFMMKRFSSAETAFRFHKSKIQWCTFNKLTQYNITLYKSETNIFSNIEVPAKPLIFPNIVD